MVLSTYTYMACKHVFHFCISRAILYYLSDVTVLSKYPNTLRKFFDLLVHGVVYWCCSTRHRPTSSQKSAPVFSRTESMCCQTSIGATGVFIVTSAQRSRNGTMKHDAMLHYASFDIKLPNSIYSDYVISVFSYIIRFLFLGIAYIIWLILHI